MNPFPLLELDVLRSFVAIVQTGSFSRASEQVFRSPGALSMQIKRLEQQLEQQLFDRSSRKVQLTSAGEQLLKYARQMLQINQDAVSSLRPETAVCEIELGISGCIDSQFLSGILCQCAKAYPQLQIHVIVTTSGILMQKLAAGEVDLAIVVSGNLGVDESRGQVLFSESLVWTMCRGGEAYLRLPVPLALDERGCLWRDFALTALDKTRINYRISYSSEQTEGLKAAVLADLAIAPLPRSMLREPLVEVPASLGLPELDHYQVVLHTPVQTSLTIQALSNYIRKVFRSHTHSD
ncbi:LysR family transcriptional regulator [Celerinatantimonas sp. YJH-8]|uniref:LysR family transcriptional regulator n=1 Tax=Celerinatantimonas sp. YJH-8 TaxID=3228714 RepID=UPI0038BE9808